MRVGYISLAAAVSPCLHSELPKVTAEEMVTMEHQAGRIKGLEHYSGDDGVVGGEQQVRTQRPHAAQSSLVTTAGDAASTDPGPCAMHTGVVTC
jgi:hypothetical protein